MQWGHSLLTKKCRVWSTSRARSSCLSCIHRNCRLQVLIDWCDPNRESVDSRVCLRSFPSSFQSGHYVSFTNVIQVTTRQYDRFLCEDEQQPHQWWWMDSLNDQSNTMIWNESKTMASMLQNFWNLVGLQLHGYSVDVRDSILVQPNYWSRFLHLFCCIDINIFHILSTQQRPCVWSDFECENWSWNQVHGRKPIGYLVAKAALPEFS